jgi:hypothetical protein
VDAYCLVEVGFGAAFADADRVALGHLPCVWAQVVQAEDLQAGAQADQFAVHVITPILVEIPFQGLQLADIADHILPILSHRILLGPSTTPILNRGEDCHRDVTIVH